MVFSSHVFVFYFLPLALAAYYACPPGGRHLALTALSYGFYMWAGPLFGLVMLATTLLDYYAVRVMVAGHDGGPLAVDGPRSTRQGMAVAVSVLANLATLGFFKYATFAGQTWNALAPNLGLAAMPAGFEIALPLGISFYTFQSMSYTLDVYRGRAAPARRLVDFACYVSMFPQLVAGPIVRFGDIADQLIERTHTTAKFARGIALLSVGLARKVLLADNCAVVAEAVFAADPSALTPLTAGLGTLAYALQLYHDFAGYSDMAVGLALMMGFVFPRNFAAPYTAASVTEFWRRWHITLSVWLRDYIYIPLGGNRRGPWRTPVHLMAVMTLGGLWHGAGWTFLAWGALHGIALIGERLTLAARIGPAHQPSTPPDATYPALLPGLPRAVSVLITFTFVTLAWVIFRADDLPHAGAIFSALVGANTLDAPRASLLTALVTQPAALGWIALTALVTWAGIDSWAWAASLSTPRAVMSLALFWAAVAMLTVRGHSPFLYFIF